MTMAWCLTTYVGDTAVGNVSDETEHEESVQLPVLESLADLVPLDTVAVETSLVAASAGNNHEALFTSEPSLGGHRRVGEPEEDDDTPKSAGGTNDQELVAPRHKSALDLTDSITDQTTSGNYHE